MITKLQQNANKRLIAWVAALVFGCVQPFLTYAQSGRSEEADWGESRGVRELILLINEQADEVEVPQEIEDLMEHETRLFDMLMELSEGESADEPEEEEFEEEEPEEDEPEEDQFDEEEPEEEEPEEEEPEEEEPEEEEFEEEEFEEEEPEEEEPEEEEPEEEEEP